MHDNDWEVSSNVDIVLFTFSRFSFVDPGAAVMRKWHPSEILKDCVFSINQNVIL